METYFSVPGSRNVYKVSFKHEGRRFIEGKLVCMHTVDASYVVKLEFTQAVNILSQTDELQHRRHSCWTVEEK